MSIDATRWAWRVMNITATEKTVLLSYADRAGEDHTAWPGRKRLAEDTGLSHRHVVRVVQSLCMKGLLRQVGETSHGTLVYQLVGVVGRDERPSQGGVTSCQGVPPCQGEGDSKSRADATVSGGGDSMSPKPPIQPHQEHIIDTTTPSFKDLNPTQFTYNRVKVMCPDHDVDHIISVWREWVEGQGALPRDIDAAFIGFAKKFAKRNPVPFIARKF